MPICSSGTQCPLYSAASLGKHVIGPHANPPSHIILTPGRPVMFHGPYFILSTMQAGTTPIFNVFGMTGHSTNEESNPLNLLVSAGSPLSLPFRSAGATEDLFDTGSSIRSPHPGPLRVIWNITCYKTVSIATRTLARISFIILHFHCWSYIATFQCTLNYSDSYVFLLDFDEFDEFE